jgi:hypothetical protein
MIEPIRIRVASRSLVVDLGRAELEAKRCSFSHLRADDRHDLALVHFEVDVGEYGDLAVRPTQARHATLPDSGFVAWLSDFKRIASSFTSLPGEV